MLLTVVPVYNVFYELGVILPSVVHTHTSKVSQKKKKRVVFAMTERDLLKSNLCERSGLTECIFVTS